MAIEFADTIEIREDAGRVVSEKQELTDILERIGLTSIGDAKFFISEFGLKAEDIFDTGKLDKLRVILGFAKVMQADDVPSFIRFMKTKVRTGKYGESQMDQLYAYIKLLEERGKLSQKIAAIDLEL